MQRHIQQVLDGEKEAFRFIIDKHKDRAFTLAVSVVKDEFLAKEVVQTAFIKAYTKLETFRRDAKFSTWLHRIVINEAFKKFNSEQEPHHSLDDISPADISSETNHTFTKMETDYQRFYINNVLKKLSAKYSLALRLFYLQDYTLKEVCEVTGWSNSNAKVILHRARNKMKEMLNEHINFDTKELL